MTEVSVGLYWRTLRHLKPIQLLGRLQPLLVRGRVRAEPPPPLRAAALLRALPARREPSMLSATRFTFLNEEHDLDRVGWHDGSLARLWQYNLHYFDDLNALDSAQRAPWHRALISRWIGDVPPTPKSWGWNPYPTSLRVVNWIKWFARCETVEAAWLQSLAIQVRWVSDRLEYHLLGNHLFANAKALVFAGLYFSGPEAEGWLQRGLRILQREVPEQILPDGGQFERSPMYHALALEDILDLINVLESSQAAQPFVATLRDVAARMLFWMRCMTHPTGELALFNDCADGIAPPESDLERYARDLNIVGEQPPSQGVTRLFPSGYVRLARGPAQMIVDVAPVGPDYLPGHAHADTLSFELDLHGRRVVVNGGTSCYGYGSKLNWEQRQRERGTAAHSTVQVAGANSSETWSAFRVGRRAKVSNVQVREWEVIGEHDGYRFLSGRPVHRRKWHLGERDLVVEDEVVPGDLPAVARYIFAPGLRVSPLDARRWSVASAEGPLLEIEVVTGRGEAGSGTHAQRFGVPDNVECLLIHAQAGHARARLVWAE